MFINKQKPSGYKVLEHMIVSLLESSLKKNMKKQNNGTVPWTQENLFLSCCKLGLPNSLLNNLIFNLNILVTSIIAVYQTAPVFLLYTGHCQPSLKQNENTGTAQIMLSPDTHGHCQPFLKQNENTGTAQIMLSPDTHVVFIYFWQKCCVKYSVFYLSCVVLLTKNCWLWSKKRPSYYNNDDILSADKFVYICK